MTAERFVRINGGLMASHVGQNVSLLGQFMTIDKSQRMMKLKLTDDIVIMVALKSPMTVLMEEEEWVNIVGQVENRNKINDGLMFPFPKEMTEKFDPALYNEMIAVTFESKEHFTITESEYEVHFGTADPGTNGENIQHIKLDLGDDAEPPLGDMNFEVENSFGGDFDEGAGF